MGRFLEKSIAVLMLSGIVMIFLFVLCLRVENPYSEASHEINLVNSMSKLDTITVPKIIIIGGSGCGFGIDSKALSEHYDMPVVNTGTHAGLGLKLQLDLFKKYISEDDIVIVVPEFSNFSKNYFCGGETAVRILSSLYPEGYRCCSVVQFLHLLTFAPKHFFNSLRFKSQGNFPVPESPYSKKALNEYGDVTNFEVRNYQQFNVDPVLKHYNPIVRKYLMEYFREVESSGARMLLLPPSLASSSFENSRSFINHLYEAYGRGPEPHFIAKPDRYALPDSLYFDTPYHLTYEGVKYRTALMIEDIDYAFLYNAK